MKQPERRSFLHIVPPLEKVDPFQDSLYARWNIEGIAAALDADFSFSDKTFDWTFNLNTPMQSRLQETPPFLKISPNPLCPDGMFPLALFDSGIGGFTVSLSNILQIDVVGDGIKIFSRDELGLTEFELEKYGVLRVSTTPYFQIQIVK